MATSPARTERNSMSIREPLCRSQSVPLPDNPRFTIWLKKSCTDKVAPHSYLTGTTCVMAYVRTSDLVLRIEWKTSAA